MHRNTLRRNLERAWDNVTPDDVRIGAVAYTNYHMALRHFARFYGTGFVQTVEAFVILSPSNDLRGNLRSLASCLFYLAMNRTSPAPVLTTFRKFGDRALSYLDGSASFLDITTGKKIIAFRHNILYPTTSQMVTVDGHMAAICAGRDLTMKQGLFVVKEHGYETLESLIRGLSRSIGMQPCDVQAILWYARRREIGMQGAVQDDMFLESGRWDVPLSALDFPPYGDETVELWKPWSRKRSQAFLVELHQKGLTNAHDEPI